MDDITKKVIKTLPHMLEKAELIRALPENQVKQYIYEIDFSRIIEKITQPDPLVSACWDVSEVDQAVVYYKNFLYLNKKYAGDYPIIPPSLEVDEIWHHHILDTREYIKDCMNIFGGYFHHFPYFGLRSNDDYENLNDTFEITQSLHKKEFGEYIYQVKVLK